jgi:aryl-alcohol dehydrogenase-like predicted oxidoreductase
VIDLYQIHWPERHVPAFGNIYYDPARETSRTSIHEQLEALAGLVKAGKVRAIGLSNETPYGVHEFVRLAEQHGLPRVATVQNVYNLLSRAVENGLDETMHRLGVSLLAYSPLAFGLLTGKYDESGTTGPGAPQDARIARYESVRKQRWGRPGALDAARRYNALAREVGMTPTAFALAFCYSKWQVASTIIGVTSLAQLDEDLDTWGKKLSPEVLADVDKLRWEMRDPAI